MSNLNLANIPWLSLEIKMQNRHLPEREEVFQEVQISIVTSMTLHWIHKLADNSFPSGAYPKKIKERQLGQGIPMYVYNKAESKDTLKTLSSLNTEGERFLTEWAVSLEILNLRRAAILIARRMRAGKKKWSQPVLDIHYSEEYVQDSLHCIKYGKGGWRRFIFYIVNHSTKTYHNPPEKK